VDLDATGVPANDSPHSGRARAKLALLDWTGAYAVILLMLSGPRR
jgi:hypothetical protein